MAQPRRRPHCGGRGGAEPRMVIREREARVVELIKRGRSQREIATEVGVSQVAVCKILRRVDNRLLATMHRERIRTIVRHHQRTEHIFRQAEDGWERSCADRQRRRQRRTTTTGAAPAEREVIEVSSEAQAGDPRFLREKLRALAEQRATFNLGSLDWPAIGDGLENEAFGPAEDDHEGDA